MLVAEPLGEADGFVPHGSGWWAGAYGVERAEPDAIEQGYETSSPAVEVGVTVAVGLLGQLGDGQRAGPDLGQGAPARAVCAVTLFPTIRVLLRGRLGCRGAPRTMPSPRLGEAPMWTTLIAVAGTLFGGVARAPFMSKLGGQS
jgi:hypothetical protein